MRLVETELVSLHTRKITSEHSDTYKRKVLKEFSSHCWVLELQFLYHLATLLYLSLNQKYIFIITKMNIFLNLTLSTTSITLMKKYFYFKIIWRVKLIPLRSKISCSRHYSPSYMPLMRRNMQINNILLSCSTSF